MLELVFVIIVVGIIAVTLVPKMQDRPLYQATLDLVSQIRYAQHLALVDDKLDKNDVEWFKKRWQIRFDGNKYSIVSDAGTHYAAAPQDASLEIDHIDLHKKYGVTLTACSDTISFDHVGRPLFGDLSSMTAPYDKSHIRSSECDINLSDGREMKTIKVTPETGYVRIMD